MGWLKDFYPRAHAWPGARSQARATPCRQVSRYSTVRGRLVLPSPALDYNLALVCAFLRIGSNLVAFITSPLILSLPDMKSLWALPLPVTRLPKSSSDSIRVTAGAGIQ